jgi:hypothetical protein
MPLDKHGIKFPTQNSQHDFPLVDLSGKGKGRETEKRSVPRYVE